MNDMHDPHDSHDASHDDHEPGDVNGNIDPAFAKAQRQQRTPRQPRQGAQPRPPRQPREGRQPRAANQQALPGNPGEPDGNVLLIDGKPAQPPRAPRPPREPRQARPPRQPRLDGTSTAPVVPITNWLSPADGVSTPANAGGTADGAVPPTGDAGVPRDAQERTRGPRRNRRGGRGRNGRNPDSREPREPRGDQPFVAAGEGATVAGDPSLDGGEMAMTGADRDGRPDPNPGAFGDPGRPMDRAARRNRNHRDKRESARPVRIGQRAAVEYAPRLDAEGQPIALPDADTAPISGVNEAGERDGERLHKVLAQQGLGSRRNMEAMIAAGEVQVNGAKARVGQVVNEYDRVHVNRRKVTVKLGDDNPRILIYHKQSGEIVSRDDPEQRDTVFDRLPKPDHGKWVAVGRLDYNSEGLMLFTTYGELANRFMHPRYEILREYSVRVLGELTPEQEDQLMDGIELEDGPARVLSLDRIDRDSDAANHWYKITLNEGRNREVRRMFEFLGLTVSRLIRISYGCVQMPSWLKRGQFKQLDEAETFEVLESVGLRSKKKLEKAARFGGRNRIPQQPLGPMRSATEHESVWTGLPADVGAPQGRGRRQGGRGAPGAGGQPGQGRRFNSGNSGNGTSATNAGFGRGRNGGGGAGAPVALQQQQFPGFGGATEMQPAGRRQRTPGNRVKRDGNGEVNGNIAPGYRAANPAGGGGGGNGRNRRPAGNGSNANGTDGVAAAGNGGGNGRGRQRRGGGRAANAGVRAEGVAAGAATMPDIE